MYEHTCNLNNDSDRCYNGSGTSLWLLWQQERTKSNAGYMGLAIRLDNSAARMPGMYEARKRSSKSQAASPALMSSRSLRTAPPCSSPAPAAGASSEATASALLDAHEGDLEVDLDEEVGAGVDSEL